MEIDIPGCYTRRGDGYKCTECGETISVGEEAIRVDYAVVTQNEAARPRVSTTNYGGIFHRDCI